MSRQTGILIDGKWQETGRKLDVVEKYTGLHMATVSRSRPGHVRAAIEAAARAVEQTPLTGEQRAELLSRSASALYNVQSDAALLLAREVAKPIKEAVVEVEHAQKALLLAAEEAQSIHGDTLSIQEALDVQSRFDFTLRAPLGVVAIITSFDSPLVTLCLKVGAALASGNTVVIKPSSHTPLTAIFLCELLHEAGFPAGYVNLVIGGSRQVGSHLLRDSRIAHYDFTGSVEVGEQISRTVGRRRCNLDLSGQTTAIVSHSADLDLAVASCVGGAFANAGQGAAALQHILVDKRVYAEFESRLVEQTKMLVVGDPTDPETNVSAMISLDDADRADLWVDEARREGAKLLAGAQRRGPVYYPTILSNVTDDVRIMREEIRAPVVTLQSFSSLDAAYTQINSNKLNVQTGVFTASRTEALEACYTLKVASVMINEQRATGPGALPDEQLPSGGKSISDVIKSMRRKKRVTINMEK